MRTYYIFQLKYYFYNFYEKKPYMLYKILEDIYHSNNKDIVLTYKLFDQIALPFKKNNVNDLLKKNHVNQNNYEQNLNKHYISNILTGESTSLTVYNSHLKIRTNVNYPVFLDDISFVNNIFICDFQNKDYFWLCKMKKCQVQ